MIVREYADQRFRDASGRRAALLTELLGAADGPGLTAILDTRYDAPPLTGTILRVPPRLGARLVTLWRIGATGGGDVILCLNGLPPLRRARARTIAYVHAAYLAGETRGVAYPLRVRLRHATERALFRLGRRNLDEIWVQTPTMARAMAKRSGGVPVRIAPFAPVDVTRRAPPEPRARGDVFFYPADDAAHKNHARLVAAWALLADDGHCPPLVLTLGARGFAAAFAGASVSPGRLPHVTTIGTVARAEALVRLRAARALIFPSLAESFGLPLAEARAAGVPILAPERDYPRDVCAPAETFDPESPRSIARAVLRFLGESEIASPLCDGPAFVARLQSNGG